MSRIIAGIYEIEQEIGSGGGGIVYLGRHKRLRKQVVLKADKRSLNADEVSLRREVDFLKELSHTYIPQVYDYVQEDGVVYTVMDYIEGESLDQLLKRKEIPTQPQVIKWSCQLLEALSYLHNQKSHGILHGDIKPANIMLRTNGDVCLIDFNIALALGEDGAVKVGYSRGYASPEHYGSSYISENRPAAVGRFTFSKGIKSNSKLEHSIHQEQKKETSDSQERKNAESVYEDVKTEKTELLLKNIDAEKTELFLQESETEKTELLLEESNDKFAEHNKTELLIEENKFVNSQHRTVQPSVNCGNNTKSSGGILLDARSDIYSLGATLYHLISGKRPSQEADKVLPLGKEVCSPAVAAIIQKAMAPDPAMRYQSAEEMLQAFLDLHKKDKRVLSLKYQSIWTAAILSVLFLAGGICTFLGLQQIEKMQEAKILAGDSANALEQGDVKEAVRLAMEGAGQEMEVINTITPQIQYSLAEALGVYDLSDGFKAMDVLELPAVPFDVVFSPEGNYVAVTYAYELAVYQTQGLVKIAQFPIQESALADVVFAGETQVIHAGTEGITAYDLQKDCVLWRGGMAETLDVSADGKVVAATIREEKKAVIYDALTGEKLGECSFGERQMFSAYNDIFTDPDRDIFKLNQDGSMLAVSFSEGSLAVFDLRHPENSVWILENSSNTHFTGGFCENYFGFTARGAGNSIFELWDTANWEYIAGYESVNKLLLQAEEQGIYLADGNLLVGIEPKTMEEKEIAYTSGNQITGFKVNRDHALVATDDNGFSFYKNGKLLSKEMEEENCDFIDLAGANAVAANRNQNVLRFLAGKQEDDSILISYDLGFAHMETRISHDKERIMFFDYQQFAVCDRYGKVICKENLPEPEKIYDQQFRRLNNTSYLEVIWYDGTTRHYSAVDGILLYEVKEEVPQKNLYEEFYTEKYRIVSHLHSAPEVYEKDTGHLVTTLEEDAYLTYVTQVGEEILTEYISTSGERFGVLLNQDMEKLAVLPGLCDVWDNMLLFDNGTGIVRQGRFYSSRELMALGETYIQNEKGGDAK